MRAVLNDLSHGGTSLETNRRLPAATKVYFEFALPGERQLVRLSGEVAWQDASGWAGIRFLDVPRVSRRLIETWLARNAPAPTTRTPVLPLAEGKACATPSTAADLELDSKPQTAEPAQKSGAENPAGVSSASNRRADPRFVCKLGAEVYPVGRSVPNFCTVSDISEGGCYVEMPIVLSGQTGADIVVSTPHEKLRFLGRVITTHPGFGMGVRFEFRDSTEREGMLRLLAVLAADPALDEHSR